MSPTRNSRLKVLVIDDDMSMLGLLKLRLEKAGYQVLLAENGIAAGQLALSAAPNLILVDVDMPYWNGYGLVQRLKADPVTRHIPMVFLTADQQMDERILSHWDRGDHASVIGLHKDYLAFQPEGFFGHYLMLVGAMGGTACRAKGRKMSDYESAIGTGQVHVWFDV